MPNRKQKDCSKGKIYFIRSNNPEIKSKYVGSTIQTLSLRMSGHRSAYKRWIKGTGNSCAIFYEFQKYGIEQFHIELIEDYPCEREEQLLARENFFIRQEDCVNKKSAITTPDERKERCKQYYQEHKEEATEQMKQYRNEHKEEIRTQKAQYYQEHTEEKKIYNDKYRQEHKEEKKIYNDKYRQEHNEELTIKKKQYYQSNKEKISTKRKEKITCGCGCQVSKSDLAKHLKTEKHKSLMCV